MELNCLVASCTFFFIYIIAYNITLEVRGGRWCVCLPDASYSYVCTYVAMCVCVCVRACVCVCVLNSLCYFTDVPKNEALNLIIQYSFTVAS